MAKNSITDFSATAASNTDIQNVDIDEGCAPSGINNAIRELMADLADVNAGTVALTSPDFTAFSVGGTTITATADQLNFVDGVTSNIQTQLDAKGTASSLSDLGVTATAAELNYNDITTLGTSQASKVVTADANGDVKFSNAIVETVYNLTGTALDPNNGTVQTKTISANTTFTDSLSAGESMSLHLTSASSYTITWPTITWITGNGNAAPTLTAADTVVLFKISTTLYGVWIGSSA
jgi:hypothetical protein